MNKKNLRKGFTTVELVIVIAVIAILATALIPTFGGLIGSANETAAMNKARQIFNDYMLVETEDAAGADYFIKVTQGSDVYYFAVEDGQFGKDPVAAPTTAGALIITAVNVDTEAVTSQTVPAATDNTQTDG